MFGLPRSASVLWLTVTLTAAALLAAGAAGIREDQGRALSALLFAIAGSIAEMFRVPMASGRPGHRVETTVSSAIYVAAVLLFPLPWAILIVAASFALAQVASRKPWFKVVYNVGQIVLSASAASLVWTQAGPSRSVVRLPDSPWALAAVVAFFVVNTVLVSAIVSLAAGLPVRVTWWRTYQHVIPAQIAMLFVGALMAVLWASIPWAIALASIPLAALYYALRSTVSLETQTVEALFQLADILDDRDPYTHGHSVRVGESAERLALALGLSAVKATSIFLAGRLHDIGKCAIKNEVLLKPGALDDEERAHMCQHPVVGWSMLAHFALLHEVATFVRGHHERWDGQGYPDGLAGRGIPIGARVIAVADAYDAMTTTRPYRKALDQAEAIRRLEEGAGTQWEASIVEAY